jgi:hypothetical protein
MAAAWRVSAVDRNTYPMTLAAANTYPIGHYTDFHHDGLARPCPTCRSSERVPNCSATVSGARLGSTPPEPTRIAEVADAIWPASTAGAELTMPGLVWCSATQYRV